MWIQMIGYILKCDAYVFVLNDVYFIIFEIPPNLTQKHRLF